MPNEAMAFRTEGTEELHAIAHRLNEAAERTLTNAVRKSMRDVAKPVGQQVVQEAAQPMPQRNGFADRVRSRTTVGIQSAIASRTVHVTIAARNPGSNLASLNKGILRHPVWARAGVERVWRTQHVPADAFTKALAVHASPVRDEVLRAMQSTLNTITRGL